MKRALEEIQIKNLRLKNRIVRSATMDPFGNPDGTVSEEQLKLHETLAGNEIGLIIAAMSYVTPTGKVAVEQNSISDDGCIESHRRLVDMVHRSGSRIILQISHCGSGAMSLDGMPPVAPSAIPYPGSAVVPRELSVPEIERIIGQFIEAAVRAEKAGYDGIQIHGAHSYLLSEFIDPMYNKRRDEYGMSIENRFRMTEKIIRGCVEKLGEDYPVFLKINSNTGENDEEYDRDLVYIAQKCKALGVAAIEYSGYNFTPLGRKGLHNYYMERVSALRKEVDIPAILVGGIRSFKDMDAVRDSGIDMVSIARPFICDPDLITRLISGEEEARCTSCSKCFYLYSKEGRRCIFHDKVI